MVADPVAAADRMNDLFGHGVSFVDEHAPAGSPVAAVSMGDVQLAFYPIPDPGQSERLWGWTYRRPQTCNLGVQVPDLATARDALRAAGIPVLRDELHQLVIAPQVTGGVTIVVMDQLLPGDPRR